MGVGHDQQKQHAYKHDRALHGIGVHDRSQAPPDDISGYDHRIDEKGQVEVYGQGGLNEPRRTDQDHRGIEGHSQEYHQSAGPLYEAAVEPAT